MTTSQTAALEKRHIRQQVRLRRQQVSQASAETAKYKLEKHLLGLVDYARMQKVASFISFDGEISTAALNQRIIADKGQVYLPRLKPLPPNRLWFLPYDGETPLLENRLGIPEVDLPVFYAQAISKLDMILMPLVAFDNRGNRLGMGGGFYDASLAHLDSQPTNRRPQLVGLAYECQRLEQIPEEPWDLPLDAIITEAGWQRFE